jgi:hypothetical protein
MTSRENIKRKKTKMISKIDEKNAKEEQDERSVDKKDVT